MKKLAFFLLLGCSGPCLAQSHDWAVLQKLTRDEPIRVSDFSHSETCYFVYADETSLTCEHHRQVFFIPIKTRATFRRSEVTAVRESRLALSALAGGAIGAEAGAAIGAGLDSAAKDQVAEGHVLTVLFTLFGAAIGLTVGQHTDFLAGPILYRKL